MLDYWCVRVTCHHLGGVMQNVGLIVGYVWFEYYLDICFIHLRMYDFIYQNAVEVIFAET